jgi:glycosyltransferase involved in cell wall biosynthesis
VSAIPIAFYAPMKSPDDPRPSGDRTMGRLLVRALKAAGYAPSLASSRSTREPLGSEARQRALKGESLREADRLTTTYLALPDGARPRLWFTYHSYYKAPDYFGPEIAGRLGISYVIAEPSRAAKRANGPWAFAHAGAEAAIDRADVLLALTSHDRPCLEAALRPGQRLLTLPPFIDAPVPAPSMAGGRPSGPPRLLAVAMMRAGDKLASYRLLAESLARIAHLPWTLDIVGDGPARAEVVALLARFGKRVAFHGAQEGGALHRFYSQADILVWPAVNEAYGMVLLESQAHGCPVVAGRFGGVPDAMIADETGLLAAPGDPEDFARCLSALLVDPARRAAMGAAGRRFIASERNLASAVTILRGALGPLLDRRSAA